VVNDDTGVSDIFSVDGVNGRLFGVTDEVTGTVFSVNDAAGLPIVEVESTSTYDKITIGEYGTDALVISGTNSALFNVDVEMTGALDVTGDITMGSNIVLTGITNGDVTGALGYTPVNVNDTGDFVTSAETGNFLTDYTVTSGDVTGALGYTPVSVDDTGDFVTSAETGNFLTDYTVTSGDVTGALGYTPVNVDDTGDFVTSAETGSFLTDYTVTNGDVTGALGYTPVNVNDTGDFVTSSETGNFLTAHPSIAAASSSDNSARTYIQDVLLDSFGHVTGLNTSSESTDPNYYLTGVSKAGNVFTFEVNGATNPTYTLTSGDITGALGFSPISTETDSQDLDSVLGYGNSSELGIIVGDISGTSLDITTDVTVTGDVEADEFIGDLRGAVSFRAKAGEALSAGEVVYISGIDGNTTVVAKADANDPNKMPAFGVSKETVSANANVRVVNFGSVTNLDTSNYSEGDELFVSDIAGQLTGIAPTGEASALQKMAKVTRSDNSAGSITVMGAGRSNAVPNLNEGRLFVGDSGNEAVADDTAYIDIANSRVGIGTTSPSSQLTITKDSASTYTSSDAGTATGDLVLQNDNQTVNNFNRISFQTPSANSGGNILDAARITAIYSDHGGANPSAHLSFETKEDAGTMYERMRIDSDGNVGIGTTSPSRKFEVHEGNVYLKVGAQSGFADVYGPILTTNSNSIVAPERVYLAASQAYIRRENIGGQGLTLHGDTFSRFTYYNGSGTVEALRIDNAGNVGIGTTTPRSSLDIGDSDLYIGNHPTTRKIYFGGTANYFTRGAIHTTQTNLGLYNDYATGYITLNTNSGEAVRVDEDGNVGIGTTSPSAPLDISSSATGGTTIELDNTSTGGRNWTLYSSGSGNSFGAGKFALYDADAASVRMLVDTSGNVGIGTTSPDNRLEVVGPYAATPLKVLRHGDYGNVIQIGRNGVSETANIGYPADSTINFSTAGSERVRINSSGNVGIGTTSPATKLHILTSNVGVSTVYADVAIEAVDAQLDLTSSSSGSWGSAINFVEGASASANTDVWSIARQTTGGSGDSSLRFNFGTSNQHINDSKITFTSSGSVGIGTTSPSANLHVEGATQVKGANSWAGVDTFNGAIYMSDVGQGLLGNMGSNYARPLISTASQTIIIGSSGTSAIRNIKYQAGNGSGVDSEHNFFTSGNNIRLHIATDGKVGIGADTPQRKLDVTLSGNSGVDASFGGLISSGEYQGIHFGYSETGNNLYRKSAIVFERTDLTSNNAQGKIHILNGPQTGSASATLSDAKLTIAENGNVGIGTTSPNGNASKTTLHINSDTNGAAIRLSQSSNSSLIRYDNTDGLQIGTIASKKLSFETGDVTAITIDTDQNVGIGITAPDRALHVLRTSDSSNDDQVVSIFENNGTANQVRIALVNAADTSTNTRLFGMQFFHTSNSAGWVNYEARPLTFWTGATAGSASERLTIKTDGNVGIGTTSPSNKLTVEDTIGIKRSGVAAITTLQQTGEGLELNAPAGYHPFVIQYNNTEYARFTNTGDFGIGTDAPAERLEIKSSSDVALRIHKSSVGEFRMGVAGSVGSDTAKFVTNTNGFDFRGDSNTFPDGGSSRLFISSSGNVGVGTTSPTANLQVGSDYTINASYGGSNLYIKNSSVNNTSYDPQTALTSDIGSLITISDSTTTGPTKAGLVLYNDDVTAGGFSPMLLFSKRESGSSPFKATMAGIYARSPLGTGDSGNWIDGELIFATAGAASQGIKQRMVIDKEGNVGIGTTSPAKTLDVSANGSSQGIYLNISDVGRLHMYADGNRNYFAGVSGNGHRFTTTGGANVEILNNGNVGIGDTTPSYKLDVNGTFRVVSDAVFNDDVVLANYQSGSVSTAMPAFKKGFTVTMPESSDMQGNPYFMSDLAYFNKKGGTVTATGLTGSYTWDALFRADAEFVSISSSEYSGSTFTLELSDVDDVNALSYGAYCGITFGGSAWKPSSVVIEFSTDNGSTYTTALNSSASNYFYYTKLSNGAATIKNIKFTIGLPSGSSIRIANIFATDYNGQGMKNYFVPSDGGTYFGDVTWLDSQKAKFGSGSDLQIYHDGSNSYIQDVGAGDLKITTSAGAVRIDKGVSENMAAFIPDGAVELYYDNSKKLETTTIGINVTGNVIASNNVYAGGANGFVFGSSTSEGEYIYRSGNDIRVLAGGADRLTVDGDAGNVGIGTTSPSTKLQIGDGSADDVLRVHYTASSEYLDIHGYGITFYRGFNYLNPSADNSRTLFIGSSNARWNTLNIYGSTTNLYGDLSVSGDLTVNGTTTTINSTTVQVDDKNIELGNVSSPDSTTADGGGITLLAGSSESDHKTIKWINSTSAWTFSERVAIPAGSASAPSLTFSNDTDTGIFRELSGASELISFSTEGIKRAHISSAGIFSQGNVYSATGGQFRNFAGVWKATTGTTGNGFQFISPDATALTISSTGDATFAGNITLAGPSNEIIKSNGSIRLNIDSNADQSDRIFIVSTGANSELFRVDESGNGTFTGSVTATSLIKSGGSSSEFLKADGSVDSNTYLTSYTESDTLATVVGRGSTTTSAITLGPSAVSGGRFVSQNYSGSNRLGVLSSYYGSGALVLGYGAEGKSGSAGFVSTYSNFSGGHSALTIANQTLTWSVDASNSQTAIGSDLTLNEEFKVDRSGVLTMGDGFTSTKGNTAYSHTSATNNPHSVTATQVGLGNVENTALSTWAGSTNITTLGTITSGEWNGSVISSAYLDSDTAHLSTDQTFSGAKTFSSGLNISVSTSNTQLKLKRTGTATGEFNIYTNNDTLFFNNVGQSSFPMVIDEDGNVGVGRTSPVSKLHVYQNDAATSTTAGITIEQDGTGDAQLQFLLSSVYRWVQGIDNSDGDKFKIGRGNDWSLGEDITITTSGEVGIGTTSPSAKLEVNGHFAATTKSFIIDNPEKGGRLQYGVVETDEHSVYVRGKSDQNIVELPEEWGWLVDEDSVTVQLTSIGQMQHLFVIKQNNKYIEIGGLAHHGEYNYVVYGTRKDVGPLKKHLK
jgi:hypothetical protein